jgi:hypothetical protein
VLWTLVFTAVGIGLTLGGTEAIRIVYSGYDSDRSVLGAALAGALTLMGAWPTRLGEALGILRGLDKNAWPLAWGNAAAWAALGAMVGLLFEAHARGVRTPISPRRMLMLFAAAFVALTLTGLFLPAHSSAPGWLMFAVTLSISLFPVAAVVASSVHVIVKWFAVSRPVPDG